MNNTALPDPSLDLARQAYCQLVHSLTRLLPLPPTDTPQALLARNQAAIAQVIALLPVNADETGLATQCVASRAQAEDVLRLLREHAGDDIRIVIKLNAQYAAMVRASLGAHGRLQRAQAIRHKREQNNAACTADEWTQHIATQWIRRELDAGPPPAAEQAAPAAEAPPPPAADPIPAAQPPVPVPTTAPPPAPVAAPAVPPVSAPAALPPPVLTAAPPPESEAVAAGPHAPAAPVPAAAPRHPETQASSEADDPPRNLPAEADYYATVYPYRAREIRHYGGLPPNCTYGPPDDDLVHAIVTGTTPALRALDAPNAAVARG